MSWQQLNINIQIFREETPVTRLDNYLPFTVKKGTAGTSKSLHLSTKPQTVPWLNGLVAELSHRMSKFDPKTLQVQFVVDEVRV